MDVFVVRDVGVRAVRARVHVGAFCVACGVRGAELVRCYDAARDGWSARAFHDACDARGPALVLGVTTKGTRFGAYNGVGWYSVEDYRACGDAFLMSWAKGARWTYEEGVACENVSDPAIYDFGAQGPFTARFMKTYETCCRENSEQLPARLETAQTWY